MAAPASMQASKSADTSAGLTGLSGFRALPPNPLSATSMMVGFIACAFSNVVCSPSRPINPVTPLLGRAVARDRLDLEILGEPVVAPLAAVARHLVAAERHGHVAVGAIEADLTRPQPRSHLAHPARVRAGNVGGEAVHGVVADFDGLVDGVVAQDRKDRTEDFLARDGHVVGHIREHSGLDVVALVEAFGPARAAGDQ